MNGVFLCSGGSYSETLLLEFANFAGINWQLFDLGSRFAREKASELGLILLNFLGLLDVKRVLIERGKDIVSEPTPSCARSELALKIHRSHVKNGRIVKKLVKVRFWRD